MVLLRQQPPSICLTMRCGCGVDVSNASRLLISFQVPQKMFKEFKEYMHPNHVVIHQATYHPQFHATVIDRTMSCCMVFVHGQLNNSICRPM